MYEVFGEFDSAEEINACAAALKEEGDLENIKILAKENGIPDFLVEEYISGDMLDLTDVLNAALGKLDVEEEDYKNNQIPVAPIVDYLKTQCMDTVFARRVRNNDRKLEACMKLIEEKCKEVQRRDNRHWVADMTVFQWAKEYYLEG